MITRTELVALRKDQFLERKASCDTHSSSSLGECKVFVGECNEQKRQGRLHLHIVQGCMHTGTVS